MNHFLETEVFIRSISFLLFRFKRGFESEPTLHSGINYAVLLLAAGHQFDTSFELRKVGEWTLGRRILPKPLPFILLSLLTKC